MERPFSFLNQKKKKLKTLIFFSSDFSTKHRLINGPKKKELTFSKVLLVKQREHVLIQIHESKFRKYEEIQRDMKENCW